MIQKKDEMKERMKWRQQRKIEFLQEGKKYNEQDLMRKWEEGKFLIKNKKSWKESRLACISCLSLSLVVLILASLVVLIDQSILIQKQEKRKMRENKREEESEQTN